MEAWQWVVLVAAVVIVLMLVIWALSRSRKRARVLQGFGPEYDRAVQRHGDKRAAEHDLVDRARRRERLEIHPLSNEARIRYAERWRAVQARFVDQPEAAIGEADTLLDQVMRDRGYPIESIDETTELVSVDHPHVIENYRAARAVRANSASRMATTEDLREALLRYRSLFDELLSDQPATTIKEERR